MAARLKRTIDKQDEQEGIRAIEFSLTVETKHSRKGNAWIKAGGAVDPRPGELPEDARSRLVAFVVEGLEEQVQEWLA